MVTEEISKNLRLAHGAMIAGAYSFLRVNSGDWKIDRELAEEIVHPVVLNFQPSEMLKVVGHADLREDDVYGFCCFLKDSYGESILREALEIMKISSNETQQNVSEGSFWRRKISMPENPSEERQP